MSGDFPEVTCKWHASKRSYLDWHEWAAMKSRRGHRQRKCPDCKRLFFKEEWGTAPRGRSWRACAR